MHPWQVFPPSATTRQNRQLTATVAHTPVPTPYQDTDGHPYNLTHPATYTYLYGDSYPRPNSNQDAGDHPHNLVHSATDTHCYGDPYPRPNSNQNIDGHPHSLTHPATYTYLYGDSYPRPTSDQDSHSHSHGYSGRFSDSGADSGTSAWMPTSLWPVTGPTPRLTSKLS